MFMKQVVVQNSGQTAIVLVMVVAIMTIVFTHVAFLTASSLARSSEIVAGDMLAMKVEGMVENGALRYIRNPSYTGETLNDGTASCTIVVTPAGGDVDIQSTCTESARSLILGLTVTRSAGVFQFSKITKR